MKEWQFDVLFFFAVAGAVFLMASPVFHLEISPTGLTGYGAILTFVLTQKKNITSSHSDKGEQPKEKEEV
jgi:hypothetical protein